MTLPRLLVNVPAESLKEYQTPRPEDGGFDLAWPSDPDVFYEFCFQATYARWCN